MNWQQAAKAHMSLSYPNEGCGVVINDQFIPLPNIHHEPHKAFAMDADALAALQDEGELQAIVHSHPDASPHPSDADKLNAEGHGVDWYICSVSAQECSEFIKHTPHGWEAPLVGRQFSYGTLDCCGLVRDYYKRELGVDLPDFVRPPDNWWKDRDSTANPFEEQFAAAGFVEVDRKAMQPNDVILMQIQSANRKINHCGVYLGYNKMLHHMERKLSKADVYGGYWMEVTMKVVRRVPC